MVPYMFVIHKKSCFCKVHCSNDQIKSIFSDNPIKSIRMDNAAEFFSKAFNDYCMALGINGTYKENKINCKTIIIELQVTNILLGSCGLTHY